jgi:hypothetical protein
MVTTSAAMVLVHIIATVALGWLYFRRYVITRPPIGVLNLGDIACMLGAIVLVPYLDLLLPLWAVTGLLTLATWSLLYFTIEPILRRGWLIWLVSGGLIAIEGAITWSFGAMSGPFVVINNLVLLVTLVGIANLWAQSGMRARDLAVLAGALIVYDVWATWQTTLTDDTLRRLGDLPFAPMLAWPVGSSAWVSIGAGDMVLATVSPLVLRKAFGRTAGVIALVTNLGVIALLLFVPAVSGGRETFPVMVLLGPLIVLHYLYWRWRVGPERTTWQYQQAEPRRPTAVA